MSGQFYLCLLRHFYSSQPACLPYTQLLSITIGASTESFSFSLGHTSYSSLHIHCSQIFGWVLTAVVSSDVLSQFRLTYQASDQQLASKEDVSYDTVRGGSA